MLCPAHFGQKHKIFPLCEVGPGKGWVCLLLPWSPARPTLPNFLSPGERLLHAHSF